MSKYELAIQAYKDNIYGCLNEVANVLGKDVEEIHQDDWEYANEYIEEAKKHHSNILTLNMLKHYISKPEV